MVLLQVVSRQDRQVAGRRKIADHHVGPGFVVHRKFAVPQAIRHRRLDLLSAGRPFDGIAGAEIDDAALSGLVVRQRQLTADVFGQQAQHRRLRRRRYGGQLVEKDHDHVALFGEPLRIARPRHGQQPHAVRRRDGKAAEVLWLANRADQDEDLAFEAGTREPGLEALGELGLADAGKAGHVHRDARLQADGDQLDELFELHLKTRVPLRLDTCFAHADIGIRKKSMTAPGPRHVRRSGHPQHQLRRPARGLIALP